MVDEHEEPSQVQVEEKVVENEILTETIAESAEVKEGAEMAQAKEVNEEEKETKEVEIEKIESVSTSLAVLSLLLTVSLVTGLHLVCQSNRCMLQDAVLPDWFQLTGLYNPIMFLVVAGFYAIIALLSMLPTGESVTADNTGVTYRRNAVATAVATVTVVAAAKHYLKFSVGAHLQQHLPQLLIPVIVSSILLAVAVVLIDRKENTGKGVINNFVVGSESEVAIGDLNFKVLLGRLAFITLIVLNYLFVEADYELNRTLSPTLMLSASMQICYASHSLYNEFEFLQTTAIHHKVGCLATTSLLLYPFLISIVTLYNTVFR